MKLYPVLVFEVLGAVFLAFTQVDSVNEDEVSLLQQGLELQHQEESESAMDEGIVGARETPELEARTLARAFARRSTRACMEEAIAMRIEVRKDQMINASREQTLRTGTTDSFVMDTFGIPVWSVAHAGSLLGHRTDYLGVLSDARDLTRNVSLSSDDLDEYVTFTRFAKGIDKYGCDWCSLANGLSEWYLTVLRNLSAYDVVPSQCEVNWKSDSDRTPTDGQLACFDVDPDLIAPEVVWNVVKRRNTNEYIEQTWCPFKHLRQLAFNRSYYAFSADLEADLAQAQVILKEKGRITGEDVTCDKCNKVINEELSARPEREVSLFEESWIGVSYMDLLRCALGLGSCQAVDDVPNASTILASTNLSDSAERAAWGSYESCIAGLVAASS